MKYLENKNMDYVDHLVIKLFPCINAMKTSSANIVDCFIALHVGDMRKAAITLSSMKLCNSLLERIEVMFVDNTRLVDSDMRNFPEKHFSWSLYGTLRVESILNVIKETNDKEIEERLKEWGITEEAIVSIFEEGMERTVNNRKLRDFDTRAEKLISETPSNSLETVGLIRNALRSVYRKNNPKTADEIIQYVRSAMNVLLEPIPVNGLPAIHPGVLLKEEFIDPSDLPLSTWAMSFSVQLSDLEEIIEGKILPGLNFWKVVASVVGTTEEFWCNAVQTYIQKIGAQIS